jgi:hypothetical protein
MPVLRFAAANARGILSMTDSLTLGRELPVTMGGYPVRVVLLPPSICSKNEEGGKLRDLLVLDLLCFMKFLRSNR